MSTKILIEEIRIYDIFWNDLIKRWIKGDIRSF